jgi:hypothetical protein
MIEGLHSGDARHDVTALTAEQLEEMERQLISLLHSIWRAQGKRRKIVALPALTYETKGPASLT